MATATDLAAGGPLQRTLNSRSQRPRSSQPPSPPAFTVLTSSPRVAKGDLFLTDMNETRPGTVLADPTGVELWSTKGAKAYTDFRLQRYQGRPVFTWWESFSTGLAAYADGRLVIADLKHRVITRIEAHDGVSPDEHEFVLTPSGTALIVSYVETSADLSRHGGHSSGRVLNGVFEEIHIASGKVLRHWESLDHIDLEESYAGVPEDASEPYDYFHINSVNPTPDGNFVISARHTWAIYKINAKTGAVMWRLGGKKSDFKIPKSARFAWQHDAQFEDQTTLRLFDNGGDGTVTVTPYSRVLWLAPDEKTGEVDVRRTLHHPDKLSGVAMGNAQQLSNGNTLVGWGTAKRVTEFSPGGSVLFDAELPTMSYRAYRHVWR